MVAGSSSMAQPFSSAQSPSRVVPPSPDEGLTPKAAFIAPEPEATASVAPEFVNLGDVLTTGGVIRHSFPIRNDGPGPMRVLSASAQQPCCTSILDVPHAIRPGESDDLEVEFRPGVNAGLRRVDFVVRTDRQPSSAGVFSLAANLLPEFEARETEFSTGRLALGEELTRSFVITARRHEGRGTGRPVGLSCPAGVTAEFGDEIKQQEAKAGWLVFTRPLDVRIGPARELGLQAAGVRVFFEDASSREIPIRWEVVPRITALPAAIIIPAGAPALTSCSVQVVSPRAAIRVIGWRPQRGVSLETPLPTEPDRHQALNLRIYTEEVGASGPFDVVFNTDDPWQPELVVSVFVMGRTAP
jgi:hypothetical protein